MKTKTEHHKSVKQSLAQYQMSLDTGQVILSPFDRKKGTVINRDGRNKKRRDIEVSYTDVLQASGSHLSVEIHPAYGDRGRIGHRLLVEELNHELLFPSGESEDARTERLTRDKELSGLDDQRDTEWMFSKNRPTALSAARAVVNVFKFFLGLNRKSPNFEETVIIPAGKYAGKRVSLITRGDSIDVENENGVVVDNWKLGSAKNFSHERLAMDIAMQELTASAIANGVETTRTIWRNGEPIIERVILSKKSVDELPFRKNPPGRIICSDGVVENNVQFNDNGKAAKQFLMDNIQKAIERKNSHKKQRKRK